MRWALETVPPFALAALRFLFAAVPALFFIRRPKVGWGTLIAYGCAIGVLQFGLLFMGMKLGMPAGLSSLVIQTQVFFTIALAAWWMHDRLDRHSLIGAGIAAAGIVVLAWYALARGAAATFAGFLLVIGAALSWAIGNVIAKRAAAGAAPHAKLQSGAQAESAGVFDRSAGTGTGAATVPPGTASRAAPTRPEVDMLGLVVWSSLAAPLPLAAASFLFEGGARVWDGIVHMPWQPWACVLFMSYFATLFGLATWNAMLIAIRRRSSRHSRC